jgi:hypothetical protein
MNRKWLAAKPHQCQHFQDVHRTAVLATPKMKACECAQRAKQQRVRLGTKRLAVLRRRCHIHLLLQPAVFAKPACDVVAAMCAQAQLQRWETYIWALLLEQASVRICTMCSSSNASRSRGCVVGGQSGRCVSQRMHVCSGPKSGKGSDEQSPR